MDVKIGRNLTGQVFGYLTVLHSLEERLRGSKIYKCQCECGNIINKSAQQLKNTLPENLSCGCIKRKPTCYIDLTGKKFGKLTVLEITDKRDSSNGIIWKCKCECGRECFASRAALRQGLIKSCGCLKASKGELKIRELLTTYGIDYETEKTFENCRFLDSNKLARFDFFVENSYIIEFDGEQHFASQITWGDNPYHRYEKDLQKMWYCKTNEIPLIRIPYSALDTLDIEDLLLDTSKYLLIPV